jgi:DNA-binding Lrp family transcriptional regulator
VPPSAPPTQSDREALAFAAEHRFVLAAQLAIALGISPAAAGRRLRRLRDAGYVRSERKLHFEPTAFALTARGMTAAGSAVSAPGRVELGLYAHDVGVGWLAVGAMRGAFGEVREVIGERRMRSEDRRLGHTGGQPRHGVRQLGGERFASHYPDLALVTGSGHRVAFELELTTKDVRRRERILRGYAADRHYDAVVYLVTTPRAREALQRSAARVGASERVLVRMVAWSGGRAPGEPDRRPAPTRRPRAVRRDRRASAATR